MTSMDTGTQLRSQEFVQRSELQSQALRQDSANQMTSGLRESVQFAQQFAMMDAESKARLQLHEQDMQLNSLKLRHMQALDAADMSTEQLRAMRLENDAREIAVAEAQRRAEAGKSYEIDKMRGDVVRAYGGEEAMFSAGFDPHTFEPLTDESRRQYLARKQALSRAESAGAMDIAELRAETSEDIATLRMLAAEALEFRKEAGRNQRLTDTLDARERARAAEDARKRDEFQKELEARYRGLSRQELGLRLKAAQTDLEVYRMRTDPDGIARREAAEREIGFITQELKRQSGTSGKTVADEMRDSFSDFMRNWK